MPNEKIDQNVDQLKPSAIYFRLEPLVGLVQQTRGLINASWEELRTAGILNEADVQTLRREQGVRFQAELAANEAEKKVPHIEPALPAEYVLLQNKLREAKADEIKYKKVIDAILTIGGGGSWEFESNASKALQLSALATRVFKQAGPQLQTVTREPYEIDQQLNRKSRIGTKVDKIEQQAWASRAAAQKAASEAAREAVLAKHQALFRDAANVRAKIQTGIDTEIGKIRAKIIPILEAELAILGETP